uniref:Ig-like domain-containing protein n=1 Tax=Erpetoichthys calabaricus TaxID=27687 RepID=A0A8C4X6Q2_ERPCA
MYRIYTNITITSIDCFLLILLLSRMGKNITFFLLIFISGINGKDEDSVTQFPSSVRSREGDVSLLHCNFTHSSAYQNVFLQWYRKEEGKIKYILQTSTLDGMNKEVTADGHFSALLDKQLKTTYLTIHAIRVTDSAFYYCALKNCGNWIELKQGTRNMCQYSLN